MKKSTIFFLFFCQAVFGDDFVRVDKAINFTIEGYLKSGYQKHKIDGKNFTSSSLGGKFHFQTKEYKGFLAGVSFYTTNKIKSSDEGIPFFDSYGDSYSILGEAYIKYNYKNSFLKIGRQEIDTPFLDTDDVGMVPNTFEAVMFVNKDIKNTTLILSQVKRWAGVDAPKPESFSDMYNQKAINFVGAIFDGIKDISLSIWYYDLKEKNEGDLEDIFYVESGYSKTFLELDFEVLFQYAKQSHKEQKDTNIFGIACNFGFEKLGLTLGLAYNKVTKNFAENGFGGGPFFTSMEHLTISEAKEAKAKMYGIDFDLSKIGINNLNFFYAYLDLKDENDVKSNEDDFAITYHFAKNFLLSGVYSDVDDKINGVKFYNTRVFLKYNF